MIDRISSFQKFVLPCGDSSAEMRKNGIEMRDSSVEKITQNLEKVRNAISDRDISEKKLKNSAGLDIDLPKFKGYYSHVDIYTFRSEFKKLIEPNVQRRFWADYLKKNCVAGAAYNLVSKIESIEEIWRKLIEVYGNTQLLLQNKIHSLGRISNLEKMKDQYSQCYVGSQQLSRKL